MLAMASGVAVKLGAVSERSHPASNKSNSKKKLQSKIIINYDLRIYDEGRSAGGANGEGSGV